MDTCLERLTESILLNGRISLNIDEHPRKCRELLLNLVALQGWEENYAHLVKTVRIPTEDFTFEEQDVLKALNGLTNLEECSLTGGRRGKDGKRLLGGLSNLSNDLKLSLSVTYVDFSFNSIKEFPMSLLCLSKLQILILDFNDIESLPENVSDLNDLQELYMRHNQLKHISNNLWKLKCLRILILSTNKLQYVPDDLHKSNSLQHIDIGNNIIEELPTNFFKCSSLQTLIVHHNKLVTLSTDCLASSARVIDLQYNHISEISNEIKEDKRFLLQGNVSATAPQFVAASRGNDDYDVPSCQLHSDINEFDLNIEDGSCYQLPCGVKILIPRDFLCSTDKVYCNVISRDVSKFKVRPTDQLLSVVLELTPSGLEFAKPLLITMPYNYSGFDPQQREITMRVTSFSSNEDLQYEDLKCQLSDNASGETEVSAYINHFSLFAVVARLVEDTATIEESLPKTLFSTVDPFTKLRFPEGSVNSKTKIIIQTLSVSPQEVQRIADSTHCPVSNVLHVTVTPKHTLFKRPITVHIALPQSLMGKSHLETNLHLMKCSDDSHDWTDITTEVEMVFTTVDVSFQVMSFSQFWLMWDNVCGVARKVYRRLITYDVQFLAMQKTTLPSIVIAQCVRSSKLDERVKQLVAAGYSGEDSCTEVQKLMEGDQFRVKIIGEIQLKSYKEADSHVEEKVLVKRFHSQYPPEKSGFCKFIIEPSEKLNRTVSGYVSFYKIPSTLYNEKGAIKSDRNGEITFGNSTTDVDSTVSNMETSREDTKQLSDELIHLDDVLITLEQSSTILKLPDNGDHPLFFGELGTGMFKDTNLRYIASHIGAEWREIGHFLGLRTDDMDRMQLDYPGQTKEQVFRMLKKWSSMHMHEEECVKDFIQALHDSDRSDLAEKVNEIFQHGTEKFRNAIKRRKEISTPEDF